VLLLMLLLLFSAALSRGIVITTAPSSTQASD